MADGEGQTMNSEFGMWKAESRDRSMVHRAEGMGQGVEGSEFGIRNGKCGKGVGGGKGPLAPICFAQERLKKNTRTSNIEC